MKFTLGLLLFFFLVFSFPFSAHSQTATGEGEIRQMEVQKKQLEYQLAYPGLLPDSPLYFLKTIRDRVVNFLITDPLKRIEFRLLQADKRLSAGRTIFRNGKGQLAESTLAKGENYFEEAIREVKAAKNQGLDTKYMVEKMIASAKKHEEIISDLESKSTGQLAQQFSVLHKRVDGFKEEVSALMPKNK